MRVNILVNGKKNSICDTGTDRLEGIPRSHWILFRAFVSYNKQQPAFLQMARSHKSADRERLYTLQFIDTEALVTHYQT